MANKKKQEKEKERREKEKSEDDLGDRVPVRRTKSRC
jgi:hypothetical protein